VGLPELAEFKTKRPVDTMRWGGDTSEPIELVAILGFVDKLNAARAVGQGGDGAGVAVRGRLGEEGEEAVLVAVELVEVGHLRGEGWVVGTPGPTRDESGLVSDPIHVDFDHRLGDVVPCCSVDPLPLPFLHRRESGGGVGLAVRREEVDVSFEVGPDGEGDELAVEG